MRKYWGFKVIKVLVFIVLAVIVFGYVSMSLWNWLVPDLFHGPMITFGQAIGLVILSKILFGGFHRGGCHGGWRHRRKNWKEKMEMYMSSMTPEQREKFREKMKTRCGGYWDAVDATEEKPKTTE